MKCTGYAEGETQREQRAWERDRWAVFHLVSIQLDKKSRRRFRKVTDLVVFPWEKDFETPDYSKEKFNELVKQFGERLN